MLRTLFFILLLLSSNTHASFNDEAEKETIRILELIEMGKIRSAKSRAQLLVDEFPDFHLAQKILADINAIEFGFSPSRFKVEARGEFSLDNLNDELSRRWKHSLYPPPKNAFPSSIIKLAPDQAHIIVSDVKRGRLYVFKNDFGEPKLVMDHYIGIGSKGFIKESEGDLKTPLGIYTITKFIPDEQLPDLYGAGAYPISYPNTWDKLKKRTGHGIWIHGVPETTYNRPPLSSEGCITINNDAFNALAPFVELGKTVVINTDKLIWLSNKEWNQRQINFLARLEKWKNDWQSQNHNAYISHYDASFKNESKNYTQWNEHKQNVNFSKSYIKVDLKNISIFDYAGEKDLVQTNFHQRYESDKLKTTSEKSMFMKKFTNGWRIIYEGKSNL